MVKDITASADLKDSLKDIETMKEPVVTIDIPDVKDIPGQENIKPAPMAGISDITISSNDEEGDELFDDDIDEEVSQQNDSDVTALEKKDLITTANDMPTEDDMNLRAAALDDTDDDGDFINEGSFNNNTSGSDLDVPGATDDDDDEELGEEDEENNEFSVGGDDNDDIPEDDF